MEGLGDLDDATLAQRVADAIEVERQLSADRRALHRIIDQLQTALADRSV